MDTAGSSIRKLLEKGTKGQFDCVDQINEQLSRYGILHVY
jgi:hypothetical protein